MDDRYTIIPSNASIPVTARRPMPEPPEPMTQVPGSTTNIYINAAAPPPAVAQPAPPLAVPAMPQVVNHYTTHQYTRRGPRYTGNSALGMAALALGIIACVICWVPWLGLSAVPIGAIGAVLGILGVGISVLFRRSSASLPFAGVLICVLAAGISIASTKSFPYWRQQLAKAFPAVAAKSPSHSALPEPPLPEVSRSTPNLFDLPPTAPTHVAATPAPVVVPQASKTAPTIKSPTPAIDPGVAVAMQRLTQAEQACVARVKLSPEYRDALQTVVDAKTKRDAFRSNAQPGSFELKDAGQAVIDADNAASSILNTAMARDPDVALARQALVAAKSGRK